MSARWALVTGAAVRLGREIALAYARAGWGVLCHYRSQSQEAEQTCAQLRALGVQAHALQADLAQPDAAGQLMQAALAHTGGQALHAVVNNASLFEADTGMDFSPQLLAQHMQVNCTAALQLGAVAAQAGKASGIVPVVVHILDQKVLNLNPDYFSYTVSKLALHQAVALQAMALAPHARVVGVAPGLIYQSGPQTQDNFERAGQVNLMRQPISAQDVARTVLFVSETQSINGVTIAVDQGQHLVPLARDVMFAIEEPRTKNTTPT
jgi:NAD(P)-dependent dehydrogenase (short-subunit alcohol dehydrogenase family)